jgi:ribosome-binding protein aMBF1 (putative translation factor)
MENFLSISCLSSCLLVTLSSERNPNTIQHVTVSENIPLGDRVRALRQRDALSQRELAAHAGLNVETINRVENAPPGELPRPSTIRKLARALGCRPRDLMAPESA